MKFLSREWLAFYEKSLKQEFSPEHTTTRASGKILELFRNTPEGTDKWLCLDWENGILESFNCGTDIKTAPRDPDYRLYGDYETWVRMLSLKDNPTDVIMSGKMEFYGNIMHFQAMLKPFAKSILLEGMVRPSGNVILTGPMTGIARIADKRLFS